MIITFPYFDNKVPKTGVIKCTSLLKPFFNACERLNTEQSTLEENIRYKSPYKSNKEDH